MNDMEEIKISELAGRFPIIKELQAGKEIVWINPDKTDHESSMRDSGLTMQDIEDAEQRLQRFAPLIMKYFPETRDCGGIIESALTPIPAMQEYINKKYRSRLEGKLLLKQDSHLAIAGSVKARGGIYEVLKHTEELALKNGLLRKGDSYERLAEEEARGFFGRYTIQVGSTGNLGMSIGIMSAAVGYKAIVHMSADAKQWKKDLLRSHGVEVVEYESDYSEAVKKGRVLSDQDPMSYFVDDENSQDLFLGYAVAAKRLTGQLAGLGITVDAEHPLFVYLPCGVGGAPGGISFGLKQVFGELVHCFFVEPTQAPCMALGMITGLDNKICVQDIGLTGQTHADGLAVGRPSGFVGSVMKHMLSGEFTVVDARLYDYMRELLRTEDIFLEPSACAAFQGSIWLNQKKETLQYLGENDLLDKMNHAVHIVWATGGSLVPKEVQEEYRNTFLD
ncbi:MAG: D-serine ammonia-lyase [Lachnospiraceae bacterium]|nr:D-serine ammonia-lyase [Lachnospiraceae bacterium]